MKLVRKTIRSVWMIGALAGMFLVFAGAQGEVPQTETATQLESSHKNTVASDDEEDPTINANGLPEMAALQEMRRHREELETKEKELAAHEAELKAREQALNEEMKKIGMIRDEIAIIDSARKKENDSKVAKLVETYQAMSPGSAAAVISGLDDSLAVATLSQMDTTKLAKILSKMEPKRSQKLSELLAGVVRAKGTAPFPVAVAPLPSNDVAETTTQSAKGGVKNDGHNNQEQQHSDEHKQSAANVPTQSESKRSPTSQR